MNLPPRAIERLLEPLRVPLALARSARDRHTVPIERTPWRLHADALAEAITSLSGLMNPLGTDFRALRQWIDLLLT